MKYLFPLLFCIGLMLSSCSPYATEYIPMKNKGVYYPLAVSVKKNKIKLGGIFPKDTTETPKTYTYKVVNKNFDKFGIPDSLKLSKPEISGYDEAIKEILEQIKPYFRIPGIRIPPFPGPICKPSQMTKWLPIFQIGELIPDPGADPNVLPQGEFRTTSISGQGDILYTEIKLYGNMIKIEKGWIPKEIP